MATVTFQQGVNGYTGTSDTMLRESRPTSSYGAVSNVNVDGVDSAGLRNQGLLYFDGLFGAGAGQIPVGAVITSATLTLQVNDGTSQPVSMHRMNTDWTALSTLSWNAFGNGIQTDGTEAVATADLVLGGISGGVQNINVTQSLQAWSNGAANFGWAFLMDGSNGWDFTSSEGATKPVLTVEYSTSTGPAAGLVVTETGGSSTVTEGGQGDSLSVALQAAPTANVTVTVAGNADVNVDPPTLTFTPGNWNTPQAVALSAVDDALDEGTETATVNLSSSSADAAYDGASASVSVTVNDNDAPTPPPPPPPPTGNVVNLAPGAVTYPGTSGADIYVVDSASDSTLTQLDRIENFDVAQGDRVDFSATGWESGDFIYRRFSVGQPFEFTRLDGPDGFALRINESLGDLDGAFIFGGTTPPGNQSPTAVDDAAATTAGESVTVNVLGNDSDPDGDSLTVSTFDATSANGGTVARSGNSLVYTPAAGFTGTDTFDYVASDGQATDVGTVSVTVSTTPPPPPPPPGGDVVNLGPGAVTYPGTSGADVYVVDSAADSTLTELDRIENFVVAEGDRVDFTATGWESGDFIYRQFNGFTRLDGPNGFALRINESLGDLDGAFIFGTAPPPPPPPPPAPSGIQVHDTMLREGRPTTSYQNAANVNIDGVDSSGLRNQGLLYFENLFGDGQGQIPDGAVINSATLTLNVTDGTSQPVAFHRMLTDWTASSTVSWNALGNGIQTDGTEAVASADVTLASIGSGTRNIDVTQSVLAWAEGAANFGWAILMDGSNGWDFTSSEGAVAPQLTVDWSVPTPGLGVTETGGSTVVTEGGAGDSIRVVLDTAPSANVTVTVAGDADIGVNPTTLTFTPGNWDTAQVVTLAAVDDALDEGTETGTVTLTSSSADAQYNGKNASVSVTINDNDAPTPPPPPAGIQVHDTMVRESKPLQSFVTAPNVNVDGVDSAGLRNQGLLYFENLFGTGPSQVPLGAVINSATLTLNVTDGTSQPVAFHRMLMDWTASSTVTWNSLGNGIQTNGVEAVAAADVTTSISGGTRNIDVTQSVRAWANGAANFGWAILMDGSNGWDFTSSEGGTGPQLTVDWVIPTPGLDVSESGGATAVTEGGPGDTISVALHTAPSANVTVTVAGNPDVGVNPTTLTFTPGNWDTAQVVNLSAIDDALQEPTEIRTVTLTSSSTDAQYNGKNASVSVAVSDNDTPPPPPSSDPVVVAIHDTTQYKAGDPSGYGSGDPSGLAYVPGLNLLFIADSEHNESPYFSTTNLFAVRPDGTHVASYSLTAFCSEPTGLAYNPFNGFLYISDDDADQIFWVNPSNPSVKLGQFDVEHLGIEDAEDPVFDPVTGNIYVLDGLLGEMFELSATGDLIRVINLPSAVEDAEGLAFNAARGTFYMSGGATAGEIFEVDRQGNLLASFDLLNESQYRSPLGGHKPKLKGLELAPSSNPNDGDKLSLFAVDYGADQRADGRLFELYFDTDVLLT